MKPLTLLIISFAFCLGASGQGKLMSDSMFRALHLNLKNDTFQVVLLKDAIQKHVFYYANGKIKAICVVFANDKHKSFEYYDENGNKIYKEVYKKRKRGYNVTYLDKNGKKQKGRRVLPQVNF